MDSNRSVRAVGSTAHFFIPLSRTLHVPNGFNKTKKATGWIEQDDGSSSPTADSVHFVFHQVETKGSPPISIESSFQLAAERTNGERRQERLSDILEPVQSTVAEAMVDLDFTGKNTTAPTSDNVPDEFTAAFDYAVSELNVLLRAFALISNEPLRLVTRESLPPMIPLATSDTQPWRMIEKGELPDLQGLSVFNLNWNIPFVSSVTQDSADLDSWLDAALVNLSNDGPFTAYFDFRREADMYFTKEGNYRIAAILYASSCKALLDELLQHTLWEEDLRPEQAVTRFLNKRGTARGIVDLVKNELQKFYQHYGWGQEAPEIIEQWVTDVASLRNRAIHYGYTPTLDEIRACLRTVDEVVKFVSDRVFEARAERPITALAVLGHQGLENRGGWDDRFSDFENNLSEVNLRLRIYKRWREALSSFRDGRNRIMPLDLEGSLCYIVISPQDDSQYFLVHKNKVSAQEIAQGEVSLSSAAESTIQYYQNLNLQIPLVIQVEYENVELQAQPTWEHFVYDVLPGHEVCASTLPRFPST